MIHDHDSKESSLQDQLITAIGHLFILFSKVNVVFLVKLNAIFIGVYSLRNERYQTRDMKKWGLKSCKKKNKLNQGVTHYKAFKYLYKLTPRFHPRYFKNKWPVPFLGKWAIQ